MEGAESCSWTDRDSRGRTLSEDRAEEPPSGHLAVMKHVNTVRGRTDHVSLSVSDVSEDADGAAMSQTAGDPLLHVLQQLLKTEHSQTDSSPSLSASGGFHHVRGSSRNMLFHIFISITQIMMKLMLLV